jgi:hypothetical protein
MADQNSTKTSLSELISWRLLKKNPSGGIVLGIFGVALVIDGLFYLHFLRRKEYQVKNMNNILVINW